MPGPKKKSVKENWQLEAYNKRAIASLMPLSEWTTEYEQLQCKHNRILQKGFLTRDIKQIITDAKACNEAWLTDVCCPSVEAACIMHIAKELIVYYKFGYEDLEKNAKELYEKIVTPEVLKTIQAQLNPTTELATSQERIQADKALKKRINQVVSQTVKQNMQKYCTLQKKHIYKREKNQDYAFLGAAGSGKSTISREKIKNMEEYIMLATDAYRGIYLPGTEKHEQVQTQQVFVKTQDMAYMIKELVQQELLEGDSFKERANVIIDGVTLENWHQKLLNGNDETHVFVAALNDVRIVPQRAFDRANNSTNSADKGRHINTIDLLQGHKNASLCLLENLPKGIKEIKIYDTNIQQSEQPKKIAAVCTIENQETITVFELDTFASFLGKAMANEKSRHPAELYKVQGRFVYTKSYFAEQLLQMVRGKPNFTLILQEKGTQYTISQQNDVLEINPKSGDIDNLILRHVFLQIREGSREKAEDEIRIMGHSALFRPFYNTKKAPLGSCQSPGSSKRSVLGKTKKNK